MRELIWLVVVFCMVGFLLSSCEPPMKKRCLEWKDSRGECSRWGRCAKECSKWEVIE